MASIPQQQSRIGFVEKYAMQYYVPELQFLVVWFIYFQTNQPAYMLAAILGINYLGKFLPGDSYPVTNSAQHNKSVFHVLPLVVEVVCTWVSVAIIFIEYPVQNYTTQQAIFFVLAISLMISPSIDASHELIHRPQTLFRAIGFINLVVFQFTVYPIQHLFLHHKQVGTSKDPITSPKNQNYYSYTINAYYSAHKFVFNYSRPVFFGCVLANLAYLAALFLFAWNEYHNVGAALLKVSFFLMLGLMGFAFVETIEYVEHYGLIYRSGQDKKEITQISSWNSEQNIFNNWLTFRFQRHSDHHMNAYKVFTTLELTDKMPRMPFSFLEAIYLALIPPLWHFVMNPFVDEIIEKTPVTKQHRKMTKIIKEGLGLAITLYTFFNAYKYYNKLL